jgi:hypothetical protein
VEDTVIEIYSEKPGDGTQAGVVEKVEGFLRSKGSDPQIGAKLESVLIETGIFSQVNVTKVCVPFSPRIIAGQWYFHSLPDLFCLFVL